MPERFAVRSRRVVTPKGVRPACVVIEGEIIAALLEPAATPGGLPCLDLGDRVLMPGLVDVHVHLNDPGRAHWEGFACGTRAAAAGGVTTLVDMPLNCTPVTTSAAAVARKAAAARGRLRVDCGLWGGLVPGNAATLEPLLAAGVLGVKAFLVPSGLTEFPAVGEAELRRAMGVLAVERLPLLVHAELACACAGAPQGGSLGYRGYLASRPAAWEEAAIALVIRLVRDTGCPAHVVHLSAASALPLLRAAREEGLPISVETCPHYLTFASEDIPDGDARFKCAPPIRDAANRESLWRALADGAVDLVASDHSPAPPERKAGDLQAAWGGVASLQLVLPALWSEARRRGHGLRELARWLCESPAQLAGLGGRKGSLAPGHDADLVAWDPEARFRVSAEALYTRHALTPWLGRELDGVVETTWLRGQVVYRRGDGFPGAPSGRLLLRGDDAA